MSDKRRLEHDRTIWDAEATSFDEAPDHGLRDATVRQAWTALLAGLLPVMPAVALDIGCGTGSLSLLLAELGWDVTGVDLSPSMIAQAQAKAAASSRTIRFAVMDAADPNLLPAAYDVIVCRHLLWTLPKPPQVLERWMKLLRPGGRLILIEGFWHTGAGIHADDLVTMLPARLTRATVQHLSDQPMLWGGAVSDERYVITAELR